ncbi:MAG: leucine dehydrogenase, partial [Bacteroidia bacterium]|nr:leucine dehydrogenase [Bacteroidia bacterium]
GIGTKDMEFVHMETKHVTGLPESLGGGGDPSPVTAYGVYLGMKASANFAWGSDGLHGKTVVVEGVGKVGRHLIQRLVKEGAKVYVTDINQEAIKNVTEKFDVTYVKPGEQFDVDMDIYAPCALGATVNDDTIPRLNCKVIAGAANNQLKKEKIHGPALLEKGVIYAPDFLINAGGLINVYSELEGYNRKKALNATENIYDVTSHILNKSREENIPTYLAAKIIAEKRIEDIKKVKSTF